MPGIIALHMLGPDSIAPFAGLREEEFELGGFIAIRLYHNTKEFLSFMWVQSGDDGTGSVWVILWEGQITGESGFGFVGPTIVVPLEVNEVPVALVEGNCSACCP